MVIVPEELPAAVGVRISKCERHDFGAAAPFSTKTSFLQGRAGDSALTLKLVERSGGLGRGSTVGEGGDTTISFPGRSPKQPLPGMRLHDSLHGRQACPKFIAFD